MYKRLSKRARNLVAEIIFKTLHANQKRQYEKYFMSGTPVEDVKDSVREDYIQYLEKLISNSKMFDADYYLSNNKDVKRAGVDPLRHYVVYGGKEGRIPSEAFDSKYYIYKNPHIRNARVNPLVHYIRQVQRGMCTQEDFSINARREMIDAFNRGLLAKAGQYDNAIVMESMAWDDPLQQRPHHLARLLSKKGILVIYIDSEANFPNRVSANLYVVADKSYIELLTKTTIAHKYYWLFSTQPIKITALRTILSFNYSLIYDFIDDFHESISGDITNQLEVFRSLELLQPAILIASANKLYQRLRRNFPKKKILFCPNAADLDHFTYHEERRIVNKPRDLARVISQKKPIVGYYGAIAPWLDYKLINNLTRMRADLNFVFIGLDYNKGLDMLMRRKNVHYLGPKKYTDLPKYSRWFDCAIIPFKKGEIAKATSPVKLYEYMAMALPTVCTRDLYECRGYDYVYISKDETDFMNNIDAAISNRKSKAVRDKLIEQAKQNTWLARIDKITDEIFQLSQSEKGTS